MQNRLWYWVVLGVIVAALLLVTLLIAGKRKKAMVESEDVFEEGPPGDREMSFWEHLAELRSRLLWAIFFWAVGSVISWTYYNEIFRLLVMPIEPALQKYDIPVTLQSIFEPLMLKLQISIAAGLVIAFPGILYEVMAFIWPALYPNENGLGLNFFLVPFSFSGGGFFLVNKSFLVLAFFWFKLGFRKWENRG
jgi:sec-independent protein translocase protein TatC